MKETDIFKKFVVGDITVNLVDISEFGYIRAVYVSQKLNIGFAERIKTTSMRKAVAIARAKAADLNTAPQGA